MKIAICMSGLTRTFKHCYQSYLDNIINRYDCDVFTFVDAKDSDDINLIKHTKLVKCDYEPKHDELDYAKYKRHRTGKYSIQGWLSQFWKIRKCYELMLDYTMDTNSHYDWVIRCRPDLIITRPIDLKLLDKKFLYVPNYPESFGIRVPQYKDPNYIYDWVDNAGHLPDQFAISNMPLMDIYTQRYNDLDLITHIEGIPNFCAEFALCRQLKWHHVQVKILENCIEIRR